MKHAIAVSLLVFLGVAGIGQDSSLRSFARDDLGFEFSYPVRYSSGDLPCQAAQFAAQKGLQLLLYAHTGTGRDASIQVTLDRRPFNLATLKKFKSRAEEEPVKVRIGANTFYYYGPGGGGVAYPDDYYYNLDGYILGISFDGPYPPTDKSPSAETKEMEKLVLQSFRRFKGQS